MARWRITLLIAVALMTCAGLVCVLQMHMKAQRAIPVEARLLAADRKVVGSRSSGSVSLAYSYSYLGAPYTGNSWAFGSSLLGGAASSDIEIQQVVYQLGRQLDTQGSRSSGGVDVRVWIDPLDPAESALLRRVHPAWVQGAWFGVALLIVAAADLFFGWRRHAAKRA